MTRTSLTLILALSLFLVACNRNNQTPTPTPVPTQPTQEEISSTRTELERLTGQQLPTQTPDQLGSTSRETVLTPQSGYQATGYARHGFADGRYTLTVLADLPDLESGQVYQVWLVQGAADSEATPRKVGQLRSSKSGYLLDYSASEDLTSHTSFVVSREQTDDNQIETPVLTGTLE